MQRLDYLLDVPPLWSLLHLPPFSFFQIWQSLSGPSGYEDLNNISVAPYYSFDATKRAIAALKLQVEEVSKTELSKISEAGIQICHFPLSSQILIMSYQSVFFSQLCLRWNLYCHVCFFKICLLIVKEVYITQEETKRRRESILREAPKIREEPKTRQDFMKCELLLFYTESWLVKLLAAVQAWKMVVMVSCVRK